MLGASEYVILTQKFSEINRGLLVYQSTDAKHIFPYENCDSLWRTSQAPLFGRGSATCRSQVKFGSSSGIAAWALHLFSNAFLSLLIFGFNVVLVFFQHLFIDILWTLDFRFYLLVFITFWILRIFL